jgi:hypothetical protein
MQLDIVALATTCSDKPLGGAQSLRAAIEAHQRARCIRDGPKIANQKDAVTKGCHGLTPSKTIELGAPQRALPPPSSSTDHGATKPGGLASEITHAFKGDPER